MEKREKKEKTISPTGQKAAVIKQFYYLFADEDLNLPLTVCTGKLFESRTV